MQKQFLKYCMISVAMDLQIDWIIFASIIPKLRTSGDQFGLQNWFYFVQIDFNFYYSFSILW